MHIQNVSLPASSAWGHDYAFNLHKQRLKLIKVKPSTRVNNSPPETKRYMPPKQRAQAFYEDEMSKTIQVDNQKLLSKLTWISNRKRTLSLTFREQSPPRSLNFVSRKREAERILIENHSFMRRLSDKPSSVSLRKFNDDYERSIKYKANASRMNFNLVGKNPSIMSKMGSKLPPLTEQTGVKKNRSISPKRETTSKKRNHVSMTDTHLKSIMRDKIDKLIIQDRNKKEEVVNQDKNKYEDNTMFLTELGAENRHVEIINIQDVEQTHETDEKNPTDHQETLTENKEEIHQIHESPHESNKSDEITVKHEEKHQEPHQLIFEASEEPIENKEKSQEKHQADLSKETDEKADIPIS